MNEHERRDWLAGLTIKGVSQSIVEEISGTYYEADNAFYRYFGEGFQYGFIETAVAVALPLRNRLTRRLVAGEWISRTRTLNLYTETFRVAGQDSVINRQRVMAHELGHAFDDQSISENINKTNTAGREAFAELGAVVTAAKGDSGLVTKELSGLAWLARSFLPASRINIYPSQRGKLEDAAFFHYLITDWGLGYFKDFYSLIPETMNRREYLVSLVLCGFSREKVDEAYRLWLDAAVYRKFFLGGYTMEELTKEAKKWYEGQAKTHRKN